MVVLLTTDGIEALPWRPESGPGERLQVLPGASL